jgi:hypothetical protein
MRGFSGKSNRRDSVPGYEATFWPGIVAPKDTPADIVDKLNKEINVALPEPGMACLAETESLLTLFRNSEERGALRVGCGVRTKGPFRRACNPGSIRCHEVHRLPCIAE